jgi:hypothetical protein
VTTCEQIYCGVSERPIVQDHSYRLCVYRDGREYYAVWFCPVCLSSHETSRYHQESLAHAAAHTAIERHHSDLHSAVQEVA